MRFNYIFFFFLLSSILPNRSNAQILVERANYNFGIDGNCNTNSSTGNNVALELGNPGPGCDCGVVGNALEFDGIDDQVLISGEVDNLFRLVDFTVSFYFKVRDPNSNIPMTLISSQDSCANDRKFSVTYRPSSQIMNVTLVEGPNNIGSLLDTIPGNNCWNQIVITRAQETTNLYANGELIASKRSTANERVDLEAEDNNIRIGGSECPDDFEFDGWIDELVFYQGAMDARIVEREYLAPEKIGNAAFSTGAFKDTTIFLGGFVEGFITSKCEDVDVFWTPAAGIAPSPQDVTNPILSPEVSTMYFAEFSDEFCSTTDSFFVEVIDPADLDCQQLLLPNAFTPNGDLLNDEFFISNSVVMTELYEFVIVDRWGNIVFATDEPDGRWDGTYNGQEVNTNNFLYKIAYRCKDENLVQTGTVTLMR